MIDSAAPTAPLRAPAKPELATHAAALVAAVVLSGGCATIVAGGPDEFSVVTKPPGAYVYLNGKVIGQTPTTISLDRAYGNFADIRIYYPGFQPVAMTRYQTFNYWVLGNFFLGMIPVVVDIITGDWQRFEDDDISIALVPGQAPPPYGIEPQLPGRGAPPQTFGNPPPGGPPLQEPRPPGPN